MPLLSVTANDIDAAGLALDAELPPAWLEAELRDASLTATAPGHVSARLSRTGDDVVVRGRVKASLTTPCARCTEPAAVVVDGELSLLLRPAPAAHPAKTAAKHAPKAHNGKPAKPSAKEEEYEFTSEEADLDTYNGETVVLDEFVREAILLEVPNFPLCSEDCAGIRPAAGSTPAEEPPRLDPRLSPLGALKAKLAAGSPGSEGPKGQKKQKKE
jgi:uncharacterized protein